MLSKVRFIGLIVMVCFVAGCGSKATTSPISSSNPSEVVATLNGTDITKKEVGELIKPRIKKFETELYNIEKAGLEELIDQKLIEQAAAKNNETAEKFLDDYFNKNTTPPTDEEIKRYYEFRKNQMGDKKYEEVKDKIAEFLTVNKKNALQRKLTTDLRASADIKIKLEPPRVEVDIGNSPSIGPKNAPVTVVEFSDYQCPFCGRARPTVNEIIGAYPKEVRYVFMDFPLSFHQHAQKAHEAALCAGDQGKYWEMNKEMFANQGTLTVADLKKYAKKVGVNTSKFDKCLDTGKYESKVIENMMLGQSIGVNGTPAFFVNGILISGARPFADFKEVIESELARKK